MPIPDGERLFIGDGGLETTMIFREGFELPEFAAFTLLAEPAGREALRRYYGDYIAIAAEHGYGYTLDTPTWRASAGWGEKLGYSEAEIADVNREAFELAAEIRAEADEEGPPIAVCGVLGPAGDGYHPEAVLSGEEAEAYHAPQIGVFAAAGVDIVAAYTLTHAEEAIGMVRAAGAASVPIERVDAETAGATTYFMINCAHPTHFAAVLERGGPWLERLGGIRANASRLSHAELDELPGLDSGNPAELASEYRALEPHLPSLRVLGGCCGTDQRHIAAICDAWLG